MFRNTGAVLLLLVAAAAALHPLARHLKLNKADIGDVSLRLPGKSTPIEYEITLTPDLENFIFTGESIIKIKIGADPTKEIVMHAYKLTIIPNSIVADPPNTISAVLLDSETQKLTIQFGTELPFNSDLTLTIRYSGEINDDMTGFYRATYGNEKMALTQFESTGARQAFPCYDEPHLKAVFKLTLIVPTGYHAIANTKAELVDGSTYKFKPTPKMSTYLVAFVVSKFQSIDDNNPPNQDPSNAKNFVYFQPGYAEQAMFALETSNKMLTSMKKLTDVGYFEPSGGEYQGMEQIAQIGIPDKDYAAGAMENWGLVTYKERLLYVDDLSTTAEKQRVLTIIGHEYGHQWFGDLVSPEWWNFIWLNEGFATYYEYFAAHDVDPEWNLDEQFIPTTVQAALAVDIDEDTRPMTQDAFSPEAISALFDTIAYEKSGSVLRMLEKIIDEENFKASLTKYLTERQLNSANEDQLWEAVHAVINTPAPGQRAVNLPQDVDIATIMKSWSTQAGYPMVTVKKDSANARNIILEQQRLWSSPEKNSTEKYYIPITYFTDLDNKEAITTETKTWLTTESLTHTLPEDYKWVIVNTEQSGYYRVNYDDDLWAAITTQLSQDNTNIPEITKSQLIDDAFNLAKVGQVDYGIAFNLLVATMENSTYIPLYSVNQNIAHLRKMLGASSGYSNLQKFILEYLQSSYEKLKISPPATGEPHIDALARVLVLNLLVQNGDTEVIAALAELAGAEITPDLEEPVYCAKVLSDPDTNFESLLAQYKTSNDLQKERILKGLACTNNEEKLTKLFEDAEIPLESAIRPVYSSGPFGLEFAANYIIEKFPFPADRLSDAQVSSILIGMSSRVTDTELATKLQNFALGSLDSGTFSNAIVTVFKNIESNQEWLNLYESKIVSWLSTHYYNSATLNSINLGVLAITALVAKFLL